jgi:hypothetical protein
MCNIGQMSLYGLGGLTPDYEKADRYFQAVAFSNQRCERRQPPDYKNDADQIDYLMEFIAIQGEIL